MDQIISGIWQKYGLIGVAVYVPLVVFAKVIWKKINGSYVSYSDLDSRLRKVEEQLLAHSEIDKNQFESVGKNMEIFMGRFHSYTQTVRDDIKAMRTEISDDIRSLSGRIDEIWAFLGKGK